MPIPEIPAILTKADWDREKGIIAKIGVGETGVGAQMEKVKNAYNAVDWSKFNARTALPTTPSEPEPVDEALKAAKAEYPKVEKVRQELRVLEGLAEKAAAVFKSKALVPKSSTEHANKVAAAADLLAVQLKSMDEEANSFEQMKQEIATKKAVGRKALLSYLQKMGPAIAALESKPDLTAYQKFNKEIVRGLTAGLAVQKDLAAFLSPWKTMSADPFQPKDVKDIKPKLAQVKAQYLKLQGAVK